MQSVVDEYEDDIYDYLNDLGIRDHLETALHNDKLNRWDSWTALGEQITEADAILQGVLAEGPKIRDDDRWWRARLPPRVGGDFADEAATMFRVQLSRLE